MTSARKHYHLIYPSLAMGCGGEGEVGQCNAHHHHGEKAAHYTAVPIPYPFRFRTLCCVSQYDSFNNPSPLL